MPDSRSRSRSPRRSSGPPLNKDKDRKPTSRELITIKTETKEDGKSTPSKSSSAANNTTTSSTKDIDREKTERRKSESTAPKSNNNSNPGWNPPSSKIKERKFSGRCRLFVGNLLNCSEDELKEMFQKYGEVSEVFVNKERGFGFIRLDTRLNAEAAKQAVDGSYRMGRTLAVRFATHASALKVLNLGLMATNELLHQAFSQFGDVERAVVVCDDRGRSKGYGVVEFARKHSAQQALQQVNDGLFLLGRTPCPVSVKQLEHEEDEDGISDEALKRQPNFQKEREAPPHFASPNTFESEWAQRWRALEEMEAHQKEALDIQFKEAREKLDMEMNQAIQEHEAMLMRQEIQRRQEELQRFEEMRKRDEMLRQAELRRQEELRLQEELQRREEELRRKEEMFRQQQKELQRHWKDDMYPQDSGGRRMDTNFRPGPGLGPGLFPKGGSGGDWAMGPGPGMGLGHPGPMGNNPRLGPGMMPPRGPPHMGGPPGVGPPRGRMGPRMPPTRPMRFDSDRDRDRDMVDRDRLAARSRDSSARDRGDYKRPRY